MFATWLRDRGVGLDDLRPLLGYRQRSTTDRYASYDPLSIGKVLDLMPRIMEKKEVSSG